MALGETISLRLKKGKDPEECFPHAILQASRRLALHRQQAATLVVLALAARKKVRHHLGVSVASMIQTR
jgi:hypothetical protein